MRILMTGATGFIGRRMLDFLTSENSNEIICLLRPKSEAEKLPRKDNIKIIRTSFEAQELLTAMNEIDVVIHLAGQMGVPGVTYEQFYEVNCNLTSKLVDAAVERKVKQFIYCSTPGVLGFGKRLAAEDEPYAPRNDYEKTKMEAEKIVRQQCRDTDTKYTIIRPDFVYGPGDTRRIGMYKLIRDKHFILTTSGKSYLHPTYIDDVIQGFICAMLNENAFDQTLNIAAKKDVTSKDYLNTIAECTDSRLIQLNIGIRLSHFCAGVIDGLWRRLFHKEGFVTKNRIDFLAMDHSSSIKKAKDLMGYNPEYSCKDGMKRTIQWAKENNLL